MRSGGIFILFILLTNMFAQPAFAYNRLHSQGNEIRGLEKTIWVYEHEHGEYPLTDNESTWYEKLITANNISPNWIWKVSADGRFPLDLYGNPLVYEPPSAANGGQVAIRAIGQNGIDDHGALDDWDSRYGPNPGYWYKKDWPAANRRAWICAVLAMIGLTYIVVKNKQAMARFVFASLWLGLLAGVVLPFGFDSGWVRSSASIDPKWITPISNIGALLLFFSIVLLMMHVVYMAWHRRSLRPHGTLLCEKCHFDLRGTIAANIGRCPECGEPLPEDADIEVDLNPPPSP